MVAGFLLSEFAELWPAPSALVRPVLALSVVVVGLQLAFCRLTDARPAAYLSLLCVMVVLDLPIAAVVNAAGLAALAWASFKVRHLTNIDWIPFTRALNVVGTLFAVAGLMNVLYLASALPPSASAVAAERPTAPTDPDIYLVLLDGYPRADVVDSVIGKDTSSFLEDMDSLGFDVAENSHSNYNRTILTVASIANGRQVDELVVVPPHGGPAQERLFTSLIHGGAAFQDARRLGYEVVAVPSQLERYAPIQADEVRDSGQLSQFEYLLPRDGALPRIGGDAYLTFLREQHRQRVMSSFSTLAAIASESTEKPRLVFAHIMAPHNPIVFRSDGLVATVPECYWADCFIDDPMSVELKSAIGEQIEFVDRHVLTLAAEIKQTSTRPAVIVFFGDHGFRHWASNKPETYRNLFLSSTPGHPGLFGPSPSPVNLIARLMNTYVGASLPLAKEDVWITVGSENGYFPLTRWNTEPVP